MNRRDFLANVGLAAAWASIAITVTDCSNDNNNPSQPSGDQCAKNGAVSVSAGHTHSVCVTQAQLTAGGAVNLTLTGSGHTHNLSLSADQVAAIAAGTQVMGTSSTVSGHSHTVTFN